MREPSARARDQGGASGPAPTELWLVDLKQSAAALRRIDERDVLLSAADLERAAAMAKADVREERLTAHRALRIVLARHVGAAVRGAPLARSAQGRPFLAGSEVDFSLSHSGGLALVGVCHGLRVGVDIEEPRNTQMPARRKALIEEAAVRLAERELPTGDATLRFIAAWTRLEAFAKAEGCGMAHVLGRIGAIGRGPRGSADDGGAGMPDALLPAGMDRSALVVSDVVLTGACQAAVCLIGPGARQVAVGSLRVMTMPSTEAELRDLMANG